MTITMAEKIKIVLGRRGMTISELADAIGSSRQNLSNKLSRDNFSVKELETIAEAMDCTFEGEFSFKDSEDRI